MKNLSHISISNEYLPLVLFDELKKYIKNLKGKTGSQKKLAGNIKEEWSLNEVASKFEGYICSSVFKKEHLNYFKSEQRKFKKSDKASNICLTDFWVNFQKKHEFNPVHGHYGLFSFIIFVDIPYDLKKELKNSPGAMSNSNLASCLQFLTLDVTGNIHTESVFVDKSYICGMYFFNSNTKHCVYPFFTSNKYRITVSGNIGWSN
jgi:hypothetical protein